MENVEDMVHNRGRDTVDCIVCKREAGNDEPVVNCAKCNVLVHRLCILNSHTTFDCSLLYVCPPCRTRSKAFWIFHELERTGINANVNQRKRRQKQLSEINKKRSNSNIGRSDLSSTNEAYDTVNLLLDLGASAQIIDYSFELPLHKAIKANNIPVIKSLMPDSLIFINSKFYRDETFLHHAAAYGSLETVKLLIEDGADVNAQDALLLQTPIFMAATRGDIPIMKYLFSKGANLKHRLKFDERNLLHRAVWHQHLEVVKFLLKKRICPNSPSKYRFTALHNAAVTGNVEIAELLVKYGANINFKCTGGKKPLQIAEDYKNYAMVQFLKSKHQK